MKHFAIIDIETTGGLIKRDRITEIAIVLSDGQRILDEYETLVNPNRSIPPNITRITGIDNAMVKDAPQFYEVAKEIVQRTEGHIFVAHNVRFDYGFIRQAFLDLGYSYNRKRMCTVQMSRRLLGLRSHSLSSLIQHYGINVDRRHRALDDARATAIVLHNLLELEGSKAHIQKQINRGVRESLLPQSLSIEDLHALPEAPGVYYFKDHQDEVVYIGKSNDIQKRVMSHFTKTTRKAEKLQSRVHSIDHVLTGSDLVAQIHEAHEIKKLRPEINRAQRLANFNTYIKTSINSLGYQRLDVTKSISDNDHILNAYSSPKSARSVLEMLIHEYGLCPIYTGLEIGMGVCSLHQYDKCLGACIHEEAAETYNDRVNLAIERINNRFEKDFAIIDSGRTAAEKSVVVVHQGQYYGHGYIDADQRLLKFEDFISAVDRFPFYPEINSMISQSLSRERFEKVFWS